MRNRVALIAAIAVTLFSGYIGLIAVHFRTCPSSYVLDCFLRESNPERQYNDLLRLGGDRMAEGLNGFIGENHSTDKRAAAIMYLGEIRAATSFDALRTIAISPSELPALRVTAVWALSRIDREAAESIAQGMQDSASPILSSAQSVIDSDQPEVCGRTYWDALLARAF